MATMTDWGTKFDKDSFHSPLMTKIAVHILPLGSLAGLERGLLSGGSRFLAFSGLDTVCPLGILRTKV